MSLQHIEVSVDALVMMSATLIIIVMIAPRVRVIDHHLMNELAEVDTILITLDILLLCLRLTHVLRLRLRLLWPTLSLLNLVLGKIRLSHHGIHRILTLGLT